MYFGTTPYGLEGHIKHYGGMYRGEGFGQPRTLVPGDMLASGHEIAEEWLEGGNGGVCLIFADGTRRVVPARIPLSLSGGEPGKRPLDLIVGDILETGDVVLDPPRELDAEDPGFEGGRYEVEVVLTGGASGHSVSMPRDLFVAVHPEAYPPSTETRFGAFVVANVLKMGAKARRNLPQYGRLDYQSEPDRVAQVFGEISTLRATALAQKETYRDTLRLLGEQCELLKGVELLITGRLQGRNGTRVRKDDPMSRVVNMLVEVSSARVRSHEGEGGLVDQYVPFIEFTGWTIDDREMVVAWIGAGELGVSVEDPNTLSEHG